MKRNVFVVACIFVPAIGIAQDGGAICTALLEHGIDNTVDYSTEYDFLTVVKDDYCQSNFDSLTKSKQDSFEVVIKKLPIKYSGSGATAREHHSYFCKNYQNIASGSGSSRYSASTLYGKAIDAWKDCVNLALGGTQIKPSVTPDEKIVDFSLSVTRGTATFTGVDTTNMSCELGGKTVGKTAAVSLTSNAISLRCERRSEKLQFTASNVDYYPAANVKVKASTGDYRVDLYEMIDGPANDRLSRLEAEIAALRAHADGVDSQLAGLGATRGGSTLIVGHPAKKAGPLQTCPAGTFVSAMQVTGSVGGKYATDGISRLTITCAPLKSP